MTAFSHAFDIRIYYEDTDHAGVVYHANYLKFLERARTELLRTGGFEQDALKESEGLLFAVTEAHVQFRRPARFNEQIRVETRICRVTGVRIMLQQRIIRPDDMQLLVDAEIHLASVDLQGRPRRMPRSVYAFFHQHVTSVKEPS